MYTPPNMSEAVILFEPDGYVMDLPRLMGRQAAGYGFLRAYLASVPDGRPYCLTPSEKSAGIFAALVRQLNPAATPVWIRPGHTGEMARVGTLYLPGPDLGSYAFRRLRAGLCAWSLVGVTHTTASHTAMDAITGLLSTPVMPWDALICTSTAVAGTLKALLEAEIEYLRWRFGGSLRLTLPQLPVIPLGVHCGDFVFLPEERAAARQALGIGDDEVVALFVGRLSFHAKAHPHAMYAGLQAAAERTGKKITLLQCGWFANESIERAFRDGAAHFCAGVKALFSDGKDADSRHRSWAAADIFISLSDNIQETFGLTPVEAMAAGLPVVVTDWDGYKETVRHGVDGFRIPTWMPPPNLGEGLAQAHEAGVENYDFYCGLTCQTVSVDVQALADRLDDLVSNPTLRQQMGAAGRARARQVFDWTVVFRQYQALWGHLGEIRRAALNDPALLALVQAAPKSAPSRMDPFRSFGHYPTQTIQPTTLVVPVDGADAARYQQLARHGLFSYAGKMVPAPEVAERLFAGLADGPLTAEILTQRTGLDLGGVVMAVSVLAKMALVRLA